MTDLFRHWVRNHARPGPWHLVETPDGHGHCGVHFTDPDYGKYHSIPAGACRICATRRCHELNHPEPLTPVAHDDLNLDDYADRGIYRKRVAETFELTPLNLLVQHVIDAGGHRPPAQRQAAVTALADAWIQQTIND